MLNELQLKTSKKKWPQMSR